MPLPHFLLILLVIVVWGFNFVVIKVGLEEVPPIFLCFGRFLLSSIPAVFFVKRPAAPFKIFLLYSLVMFVLQFALMFFGISIGVSAGLASLLLQLQAFFSILMAALWLKEKVHIWSVIGAAVSFSGIGLVGMNLGGEVTLLGLLLVVLAAAFWGAGSLIVKKLGDVNMISLVIWGSLIAWPPLLAASILFEGMDQILYLLQNMTWTWVGATFYIAYLSTIFGFGIWNWLLQRYPISTIAPFTLLVPLVAVISASYCLGEPLQLWKIVAGVLVIVGLCINLIGPKIAQKFGEKKKTVAE